MTLFTKELHASDITPEGVVVQTGLR